MGKALGSKAGYRKQVCYLQKLALVNCADHLKTEPAEVPWMPNSIWTSNSYSALP